ncbi:hypothetical protein [Leptospira sp. GIMC2001]|uniref:hypothetical protein n=1 Tax=Leptospira sp. GIMC2001 TaxID=1513297 RepID=UPI00234B76D5|nr:hypothetical protein [Leptospira sp. GIMC2001]WCL51529.1 hypothetical protein O4O04_20140 [Leptospira sp. GIMC2001]
MKLPNPEVHHITPNWKIWVYGFVSNRTYLNRDSPDATNLLRISEDDLKLLDSPFELSSDLISRFSYTDTLERGMFKITINNGAYASFIDENKGTKHFVSELLEVGTIFLFRENECNKFAGYTTDVFEESNSEGQSQLILSGGGLDELIRGMNLYIDAPLKEKTPVDKTVKEIVSDKKIAIVAAINSLAKIIQEAKSPTRLIKSILEQSIDILLNEGAYGGYSFNSLLIADGVGTKTYTDNFIHVISWINSAFNFNSYINYWTLLESISTAPLYELFIHYDDSTILKIEDGKILDSRSINRGYIEDESVEPGNKIGHLVFRQTPFRGLDRTNYEEGTHFQISETTVKRIRTKESRDNYFSGFHVSLGIMDQLTSSSWVPVTWNPELVARFGSRVFSLTLDGVGVPPENTITQNEARVKTVLERIQADFVKFFGEGDFTITGSLDCNYYRGATKGKYCDVLSHDDEQLSGANHPVLKRYYSNRGESSVMPRFYITGVTVDCAPGEGRCDMTLEFKWADRGWRNLLKNRLSRNETTAT